MDAIDSLPWQRPAAGSCAAGTRGGREANRRFGHFASECVANQSLSFSGFSGDVVVILAVC